MNPAIKLVRSQVSKIKKRLQSPADYTKENMTVEEIGTETLRDVFNRMGWKFDESKVTVKKTYEKPFGFDSKTVAKNVTGTIVEAMESGNLKSLDKKKIAKLIPERLETTTGLVKVQKRVVPVFKVPPVEEIKAKMIVHELTKKAFPNANISEPVLQDHAKEDIVEAKERAQEYLRDKGITSSVDLIDYVSPEKYSEMAFDSGGVSTILSKRNLLIAGGILLLVIFMSK